MRRLLDQTLWLLSTRASIHGYAVAYAIDDEQLATARARLEAAFDLLATTRPRWLRRMRTYVSRVQVRKIIHSVGLWDRTSRQVELDQDYLCRPTVSALDIASTLVHEFTHARLDAAGIRYTPVTRTRVERACTTQELAFLHTLPAEPAQQALVERMEQKWARAEELWGDAASDQRWRHAVQTIGIPPWLMHGLLHYRRWRRRFNLAA